MFSTRETKIKLSLFVVASLVVVLSFLSYFDVSRFEVFQNIKPILHGNCQMGYTIQEEKCLAFVGTSRCSTILQSYKGHYQINSTISMKSLKKLGTTLLVVHFNTPQYGSAVRSYTLYRRIFAKIVFCGPEDDESEFWPHYSNDPRDSLNSEEAPFIPYGKYKSRPLLNPYICVPMALQRYPGHYTGVVAMSDDVIFNFWNVDSINNAFDRIWLMSTVDMPFEIDKVCTV